MKVNFAKIVELSHDMLPGREHYYLNAHIVDVEELGEELGDHHSPGTWYVSGSVDFSTHCGTHVEFPYHHVKDGMDAKDYPLENLIGEAVVLDFVGKKANEAITLDELKAKVGQIKDGDIVFLRTGFDKKWRSDDWQGFPYVAHDAMEWLLQNRKIKAIGTDATSLEDHSIPDQPNHNALLGRGVAIIESLANLDKIENGRAMVFILPLPIKGVDSSPVRIIAINNGGMEP